MSVEFWDEQPSLFALADVDILLAIDATDSTSKQFNASILRAFTQTPWVSDIDAALFNLGNVGLVTFGDNSENLTSGQYGFDRTGIDFDQNIGNISGTYTVSFNGTAVHSFTNTTYTGPTVIADGVELANLLGTNPFFTSNSASQDLQLTGNLGIGTLTPVTPLQVVGGNITVDNDSGLTTIGGAFFGSVSLGETPIIKPGNSGVASLVVQDFSSNTLVLVDDLGDVGIGTTPASRLHIDEDTTNTDISAGVLIENDGLGDAVLHYRVPTTIDWSTGIDNSDEDNFKIAQSDDLGTNTAFTIEKTTLDVGIGTADPTAKLTIHDSDVNILHIVNTNSGTPNSAGIIAYSDPSPTTPIPTNTRLGFYLFGGSTDGSNTLANTAGMIGRASEAFSGTNLGTELMFEVTPNGTDTRIEAMTIDNTGFVGIGTDAPTLALDVIGSIQNSESYVFSDGSTQPFGGTSSGFDWHVASAVYNGVFFSVLSADTSVQDVKFKPDGTKMYVTANTGDDILDYDLTIPWDITSATLFFELNIGTETITPQAIVWRSDGTQFWLASSGDSTIYQYDVSTPWELSSAAYNDVFKVLGEDTSIQGIAMSPDGKKMYTAGNTNDTIFEYDLPTPWDVFGAVYNSVSFDVSSEDVTPTNVQFKNDGTIMYVTGIDTDSVYEYQLGEPWSLAAGNVTLKNSFDLSNEDTAPTGVFFKQDGSRMYISGNSTDRIFEYDLGLTTLGKVGIGTETPASPLHIFENTTTDAAETGLTIENQGALGDAITHYITSGANWTTGVNNSDSDKYEISDSVDLDFNVRLALTTDSKAGFNKSNPTSTVHIFEDNGELGVNGGLTLENAGAGDSLLHFFLSAATAVNFTMGIDNTDDSFKIAPDTTLTTNTALTIDTSGNITMGDITVDQITFDNQGAGANPTLASNSAKQSLRFTDYITSGVDEPLGHLTIQQPDRDLLYLINTDSPSSVGGAGLHMFSDSGAAALNGEQLAVQIFGGVDDAISTFQGTAQIGILATENWSGTGHGTKMRFVVTPNGTTIAQLAMTIADDTNVGIGIADPISLLHVYQDNADTGTTTGLTIEQDGTGDAVLQFLLTGDQRWVAGIDNSNFDALTFSSSTDLDSNAVLILETTGMVGVGSPVGALFPLHVQEDSTATSLAGTAIQQDGTGDSVLHYAVAATNWSSGIDNSDSDKYKISKNLNLGTDTFFTIDTAGNTGIGNTTPLSILDVGGTLGLERTATAVNTNTGNEVIIGVTSDDAVRTITIDTADIAATNRIFIIKDEGGEAATFNITIQGEGGETIDGAGSAVIVADYGVVRLYSNGSNLFTW